MSHRIISETANKGLYNDSSVSGLDSGSISNNYARVRLVADLSAKGFKTKTTRELALWHCLRALNFNGSGYVYQDTAIEELRFYYGYSTRTIFRILSRGEGVFWDRFTSERGSVIKLQGLRAVCEYYSTPLLNTPRWYEVPADRFDSPNARKNEMWLSIAKPKGMRTNPISRQSLETYTGVQRRTQQRYDNDSNVVRSPRYRPGYIDLETGLPQSRLPNVYHNRQLPGHVGMLRKVRQLLKSFNTDEAMEKRRYFASAKSMLHAHDHDSLCFILTRPRERQIYGRVEYQAVDNTVEVDNKLCA